MVEADGATGALSRDKLTKLTGFLGALPPSAATKLFAALEADRAGGGDGFPYDVMLSTLRRRLLEQDADLPPRMLTVARLFFRPFEDLFVAKRTGRKRRARIARSSLAPLWRLVLTDPHCASAARAAQTVSEKLKEKRIGAEIPERDRRELNDLMETLYSAAGRAFARMTTRAERDDAFRAKLAERLGGAAAYHDLIELTMLLAGARQMRALRRAFPKPVGALTEEELYTIRRIYAACCGEAPDAAPYVLLAIAARMAEPWQAVPVYHHFTRIEDETLSYAKSDADVLLETLFEDLEADARGLEREAAGTFDPQTAQLKFARFIEYADGVDRQAARRRDAVIMNRVAASREIAAEALERFAEQAVAVVRAAMPVRKASGSSRLMALRPDIARTFSPRLVDQSRAAATFVAGLPKLARKVEREGSIGVHLEEITTYAKRYADDLVTEIRAAEGEDRLAARRLMEHTLRLIAPLIEDEEVGLIRDRAGAAAVSA